MGSLFNLQVKCVDGSAAASRAVKEKAEKVAFMQLKCSLCGDFYRCLCQTNGVFTTLSTSSWELENLFFYPVQVMRPQKVMLYEIKASLCP